MQTLIQVPYHFLSQIRETLSSPGGYRPQEMARNWKALCKTNETPSLFHSLSVYAMGCGHIALAKAMIEERADPIQAKLSDFRFSIFHGMHVYGTDTSGGVWSIPQLLARQDVINLLPSKTPKGNLRRPRTEVLEYIMTEPGIWNCDINQIKHGATPLVAALSSHKQESRYFRSERTPEESELTQFMETLIGLGADINPDCEHNLLEASIPDFAQSIPSFSLLDRVISWGADTTKHGPHAWARAIARDVDNRYPKSATYGPRTTALMERGIPLSSPANLRERFSPLAQSFLTRMTPIMQQLIRDGADPCWVDPITHATLPSLAGTRKGNLVLGMAQFPKGSFTPIINMANADGNTALHGAVNALDAPLVERLLEEGANIDLANKKGQKPIQAMRRSGAAAAAKFDDVADLLLAHGADLGAERHGSGLHQAAALLSAKTIARLLSDGEDPHKKDAQGRTPLSLLFTANQQNATSYFNAKRGAQQVSALRAFVGAGADIHRTLPNGSTLLHLAMQRCCDMAIVELIAQGADINALDKSGRSPLHMWNKGASHYYAMDTLSSKNQAAILSVVEAFIIAGADMESLDSQGRIAFEPVRGMPAVKAAIDRMLLTRQTPAIDSTSTRQRMRL